MKKKDEPIDLNNLKPEEIMKYEIADELSFLGVQEYYLQKYRPIPEDKVTKEADCDKFFNDVELLNYLSTKFKIFDVRK